MTEKRPGSAPGVGLIEVSVKRELTVTMNQRYKTLKRARQLNDPLLWDDYKRLRNKVSTMTKKAKADYYSKLFDEVKSAAAYWSLLETTEKDIRNNKSKQTSPPIKEG